jgi:pyroglutamyl-peptidase
MHRRRSRERRAEKPRAAVPAPAPAAKRRAREGAVIPDELRLSKGRESNGNVVLVTGFDCFGGETMNPSWEICKRLPREIAGMRVETCLVPCEFRRAIEVVAEAIERHRPSIVLSVGQAGGRSRIGVERVAINVDDARIPDNAGLQPMDEAIASNGPPAYFATVPVKAMARAIRAAGVPAEVSNSAGTYVCNHVMYGVLHFIAASVRNARAGFIHVPYDESQVLDKRDVPAMSIDSMTRGIVAAIEAAARTQVDIAAVEGALD